MLYCTLVKICKNVVLFPRLLLEKNTKQVVLTTRWSVKIYIVSYLAEADFFYFNFT